MLNGVWFDRLNSCIGKMNPADWPHLACFDKGFWHWYLAVTDYSSHNIAYIMFALILFGIQSDGIGIDFPWYYTERVGINCMYQEK